MVFCHLINMASGSYILVKPNYLSLFRIFFFHRDKHVPVDMAILDFSKAFDVVPHRRLLGKLSLYGINGPILRWIEVFVTDRVQGVVVEGFRSPEGRLLSGVPQGTVLGPLVFASHK